MFHCNFLPRLQCCVFLPGPKLPSVRTRSQSLSALHQRPQEERSAFKCLPQPSMGRHNGIVCFFLFNHKSFFFLKLIQYMHLYIYIIFLGVQCE